MHQAIEDWQSGRADWIPTGIARVRPAARTRQRDRHHRGHHRAGLRTVSVGVGTMRRLGPDDEILLPDDEYTSVLYPCRSLGKPAART